MTPRIVSPTHPFSAAANKIRGGAEFKSYQETLPFVGHLSREQTQVSFEVEEVKPRENCVALLSTRTI